MTTYPCPRILDKDSNQNKIEKGSESKWKNIGVDLEDQHQNRMSELVESQKFYRGPATIPTRDGKQNSMKSHRRKIHCKSLDQRASTERVRGQEPSSPQGPGTNSRQGESASFSWGLPHGVHRERDPNSGGDREGLRLSSDFWLRESYQPSETKQ